MPADQPTKCYKRTGTDHPLMAWYGKEQDGKLLLHWIAAQHDGDRAFQEWIAKNELTEVGYGQWLVDQGGYYRYDPNEGV